MSITRSQIARRKRERQIGLALVVGALIAFVAHAAIVVKLLEANH